MPQTNVYLQAFNVGVQDKKHLARVDLERMRLAAETQTNILPLTSGPAFMRPGLEYIGATDSNDVCRVKEFVFGATDASLMEFTDLLFRVKVNDVTVTRPAVTAAITNGDFSAGAGWTLTATTGATSTVSGGYLNLTAASKGSRASATQSITINEIGTEHALRIVVERGPVILRLGSASGGDQLISETTLRTGTHSLAFTPAATPAYLSFHSEAQTLKRVDSVTIEAAGVMTLPTIWAESDLFKMRFAQSADVVFTACKNYKPQRIERRSARSWSIVDYRPDNGPFSSGRTRDVKLTPSVTEGNGTLTASSALFNSDHVGSIFTLFHEGFKCVTPLSAEDEFTEPFRVTGITDTNYDDRNWTYSITGTWVGTLRWQRSFDSAATGFKNFRYTTGTATVDITGNLGTTANADGDDNSIIWYKLGFKPASYTSGTATITVNYDGGGGSGVARVTGYTSSTVVDIEILDNFQNTTASSDWREGEWSANQYWPSAVAFAEGRLWWSGSDRLWGSVSDDYDNFDDSIEGDSAPISRSIATGGVNDTQWMIALQRLLVGTEGAISTCKSSSLDEPLTPSNLSIKDSSSTGASSVDPVKVDGRALFVDRSGTALFELSFDGTNGDYNATQLSKLATDLFQAGIKTMAVQRRPDTRVWIILDDGSCVCCVYEPLEQVLAFIPIETDGDFESVAVLPADAQDRVYFSVARTINGSTVRYVEKMALDTEVKPVNLCKVMDAFKTGTNGPASVTVNAGTHLIGETVVVWADGVPITQEVTTSRGTLTEPREFTVDGSGNITLPSAVTNWVVGLGYRARYRSARLAYAAAGGTPMLQMKKVDSVGTLLADFVRTGIRFGSKFDDATRPMFPLPALKEYAAADNIVSDIADEEAFMFPGEWSTDGRVCFEWESPNTATLVGLVLGVTTNG